MRVLCITKYFIPEKSILLQNYSNPFNPETWIPYQLKEDNNVVIRVYTLYYSSREVQCYEEDDRDEIVLIIRVFHL